MNKGVYDVVVIGAGIGGMCAAALLSHNGYKTLVVERLPQLGGRCSTIEFKGHKIPYAAQEQPVDGLTARIFKKVGAVFDVVPLPPIVYRISGRDYPLPSKGGLFYLLSQVCDDTAEIAKDMEFVFETFPRLKEREKQLGGTLSGGEQQMLAIGRAMMGRPRIMLLDEPSMGLAPLLVRDIFGIIEYLNKEQGTTVLLVEQNAHMALAVASRGYVLQTGSIVLSDNARALQENEMVRKAYLGE